MKEVAAPMGKSHARTRRCFAIWRRAESAQSSRYGWLFFVESNALTRFQELAPSVLPSEIVFHSNLAEKGRHDVGVELRAGAAEHLGNGIFETP